MQIIEIRVLDASNQVQFSAGAQFSEADVARLVAMVKGRYPATTDAESFAKWAGGITLGTIANMQSYENDVVRAAIDAPAPVQFKPVA